MQTRPTASVVTIGSELVEGLRVDTNTAEIARELSSRGFSVIETVSVGDDEPTLAAVFEDLVGKRDLVVSTGGLGPTHDDVTREAAAKALGVGTSISPRIVEALQPAVARHSDPRAAAQVLSQAFVLDGAEVLDPVSGTAPGQAVATPHGLLVLLPGPPSEMRPMLASFLARFEQTRALPRELGITGLLESDVQMAAQRALEGHPGVDLTVLAKPGDVRVILFDGGGGAEALDSAASAVALEIGQPCYSADGSTLPEVLVRAAVERGVTLAVAESCTGGLVAGALTEVAGSSEVLLGGVVSYSNRAKSDLLGVDPALIEKHGAVSSEVAAAMALGARDVLHSDIAVSVTGIAGPDGGSAEKPVGLVWFGVVSGTLVRTTEHRWPSRLTRESIRALAVATALDLLRHEVLKA